MQAPGDDAALDMIAIAPLFATKEVFADIRDATLYPRLARGMAHRRRIEDEAAMRGVLVEDALKDRVVAIRLRHGRGEIVDHQTPRHTTEEEPGVLQTPDDIAHLLRKGGVDVLVPAEG